MVVHLKETRPISVSDNNDNHKPTKSFRPPKSYNNTHFTFVCIFILSLTFHRHIYIQLREPILFICCCHRLYIYIKILLIQSYVFS